MHLFPHSGCQRLRLQQHLVARKLYGRNSLPKCLFFLDFRGLTPPPPRLCLITYLSLSCFTPWSIYESPVQHPALFNPIGLLFDKFPRLQADKEQCQHDCNRNPCKPAIRPGNRRRRRGGRSCKLEKPFGDNDGKCRNCDIGLRLSWGGGVR